MALESIGSTMAIQSQPAQKQPAPKADADKTEVREQPSQDQAAVVDATTLAVAKNEKKEQNNGEAGSQKDKDKESEQITTTEQLKKAVETINKNVTHSEAVFGIHEKTNRITIKIVDKETKELIMELPPEKTLDMIAKAWELAGLLIDERR